MYDLAIVVRCKVSSEAGSLKNSCSRSLSSRGEPPFLGAGVSFLSCGVSFLGVGSGCLVCSAGCVGVAGSAAAGFTASGRVGVVLAAGCGLVGCVAIGCVAICCVTIGCVGRVCTVGVACVVVDGVCIVVSGVCVMGVVCEVAG